MWKTLALFLIPFCPLYGQVRIPGPGGNSGAVGGGTVSVVQTAGDSSCRVFSGTAVNCVWGSNATTNDTGVFHVSWWGAGATTPTITSILDNCSGSSYVTNTATPSTITTNYFYNDGSFKIGANSSCQLTVNFSGAVQVASIVFEQVHCTSGVCVIDQHSHKDVPTPGTGANAVITSTVSTTKGSSLILGALVDISNSQTMTAGTGFTAVQNSGVNMSSEKMTQSAAGSITATWTNSAAFDSFITGIITIYSP